MPSPSTWPIPGSDTTRARVFRIEVERPMGQIPRLTYHMQEAITSGAKTFMEYRPDLAMTTDLMAAITDPELSDYAKAVGEGLDMIGWILYQRKIAGPTPEPEPISPEA